MLGPGAKADTGAVLGRLKSTPGVAGGTTGEGAATGAGVGTAVGDCVMVVGGRVRVGVTRLAAANSNKGLATPLTD